MEKLNEIIKAKIEKLSDESKLLLESSSLAATSKFPFNQFANIFAVLFTKGELTYSEFTSIRDEYFKRNPYIDLFENAPRTFGQTWGEAWLRGEKKSLQIPPSREGYKAQFDLWLPTKGSGGIRIEVKSSRVAANNPERQLVERAYKKPCGTEAEIKQTIENELSFKMNFQQLKPEYCDVFIWISVWLDDIDIWVIPSDMVKLRPKNAKRRKPTESIVNNDGSIFMGVQHAGGKGGEVSEGQISVTSKHFYDLTKYKVTLDKLVETIKRYGSPN